MSTNPNPQELQSLLAGLTIQQASGELSCKISSIEYDSRRVKPGALFVALPGTTVDGDGYIEEAAMRGAVAAVSQRPGDFGGRFPYIQVPCARQALAQLSDSFYGHPAQRLCTVGITGTNGKTTVSFMLRDIFRAAQRRPGLIGTVRYEIGSRVLPASRTTPESPDIHSMFFQMERAGCDSAVMEVSSHALDQSRVAGIVFDVGVFTNLTQDHLDYHGTLEDYFAVKSRLFDQVQGAVVVNVDDLCGKRLVANRSFDADVLSYGFSAGATVRGIDPMSDASGSRMRVESPWGTVDLSLQLIGRFNLYNALAAFAAAASVGIPVQTIQKALAEMQSIPGRLEAVGNSAKRVYVDYAHTDDALSNVLKALRSITPGRLIVVFGCGGNRDVGKRRLMGQVVAQLADYSIVTNDNPRNEPPERIAADIAAGFDCESDYEVCLNRTAAIARGVELVGEGDVLLVAGKGHETVQEIGGAIFPFDDREVVREAL